jgi:hypothetical protein
MRQFVARLGNAESALLRRLRSPEISSSHLARAKVLAKVFAWSENSHRRRPNKFTSGERTLAQLFIWLWVISRRTRASQSLAFHQSCQTPGLDDSRLALAQGTRLPVALDGQLA